MNGAYGKGSPYGPTHLPHRRTRRASAWPDDEETHTETRTETGSRRIAGCPMAAMGWSASELPDRSQRPEGHVAGGRTSSGLEAISWRRLLLAGGGGWGAVHDVRQTASRSGARGRR